jgi:hypothetical protein
MATILTWDNANFKWDSNPYTWDEVVLVREIAGAGPDYQKVFDAAPEKKKKFIKIMCKVQGTEYKETKEVKDVSIRIKDVELVVNEVLGVNLDVKV